MSDRLSQQRCFGLFFAFEKALSFESMSDREQSIARLFIREAKVFLNWMHKEDLIGMHEQDLLINYAKKPDSTLSTLHGYSPLDAARLYLNFISQEETERLAHADLDLRNGQSAFRFFQPDEWQRLWDAACKDYEELGEVARLVTPVCLLLMTLLGLSIDEIANLHLHNLRINYQIDGSAIITCRDNSFILPSESRIVALLEEYLGHSMSIWSQQNEKGGSDIIPENAFILATSRGKYSSSWLWRCTNQTATSAGIGRIYPVMFRLTFFRARFVNNRYLQRLIDSIESSKMTASSCAPNHSQHNVSTRRSYEFI